MACFVLTAVVVALLQEALVFGSYSEQIIAGSAKPRLEKKYFIYDVNPGEGGQTCNIHHTVAYITLGYIDCDI